MDVFYLSNWENFNVLEIISAAKMLFLGGQKIISETNISNQTAGKTKNRKTRQKSEVLKQLPPGENYIT